MTRMATTTAASDIDSLVRDYYIDSSNFIHQEEDDKRQQGWSNEYKEEDIVSYRYCDICRLDRADRLKFYCYSNKGLNRQLITICSKCFHKYNHKKYERKLQRLERFVAEIMLALMMEMDNVQ
jgi:hypothetical protein